MSLNDKIFDQTALGLQANLAVLNNNHSISSNSSSEGDCKVKIYNFELELTEESKYANTPSFKISNVTEEIFDKLFEDCSNNNLLVIIKCYGDYVTPIIKGRMGINFSSVQVSSNILSGENQFIILADYTSAQKIESRIILSDIELLLIKDVSSSTTIISDFSINTYTI